MKPIILEPREVHICADTRLVFQVVSSFGGANAIGGYSSKILKDDGQRKLVEFHTPLTFRNQKHITKSVEWVQLHEPE